MNIVSNTPFNPESLRAARDEGMISAAEYETLVAEEAKRQQLRLERLGFRPRRRGPIPPQTDQRDNAAEMRRWTDLGFSEPEAREIIIDERNRMIGRAVEAGASYAEISRKIGRASQTVKMAADRYQWNGRGRWSGSPAVRQIGAEMDVRLLEWVRGQQRRLRHGLPMTWGIMDGISERMKERAKELRKRAAELLSKASAMDGAP